MDGFMPVDSNNLITDTKIGCDLYLFTITNTVSRYVLLCRGETVFDKNKREMLLEKSISKLYIKKNHKHKYEKYLESNFQNLIHDRCMPYDEKTKIVHNTAKNLVKDLFNDPRSGNVERTKKFAYNLVDLILNDHKAMRNLLKIAVHEYYTYTHSVNVATIGTLFANELGVFSNKELKHLCTGILLHDIGKTKISSDILSKKGKLTKEEFTKVKEHPDLGVQILKETGINLEEEFIITLQHHENYDGTGYPTGLQGDEIHVSGKIARIIDVYDALTTKRSYADAMRPFAALAEMKTNMLHCFDTEIFKKFINFLGPYDPRKKRRENDKVFGR